MDDQQQDEPDPFGDADTGALWPGDTGTLLDRSRRALVELVKGPYLSRPRSKENWTALLADEPAIRSRLADLFLELVIDRDSELAFVRNAPAESAPRVVRSANLTFMDTAMLLALRHTLLTEEGRGRVIIGQDELYEALQIYRAPDRDETDFRKRMNASWQKMMHTLRVIHAVGEDRAEISPVVRLLVDADQVQALQAAFERAAATGAADAPAVEAADDAEDEGRGAA
jgi:hypothetical protein